MSMSIQHIHPADATISATTMYKHMRPANVAIINDTRSLPLVSHSFIPGLINISASGLADQDNGWGNDWEMLMGVRRVVLYMDAVVKVFCIHTPPNFSLPWQRNKQSSSNSTGFVIGGRRILTHAHSVDYHTEVKVKKRGSDTRYLATVLAIGTECDIAMLTVSDDEFWEGISPVEFGDLPARLDAVTVVGYPNGGGTISVTRGAVLRMEILPYVHGPNELLGMQIDAAINSGNSGGPALMIRENAWELHFSPSNIKMWKI